MLSPGDAAPWFAAPSTSAALYNFDTVAGRYVVLCFLGSAGERYSAEVAAGFLRARDRFDDENACFFGVSTDPADAREGRLRQQLPGYRFFWDFERQLSRLYGVCADDRIYLHSTLILDPRLRVLAVVAFDRTTPAERHVAKVLDVLGQQPPIGAETHLDAHAPVLVVPRVFEPAFCDELKRYFLGNEPRKSGFMREREGKTVEVFDDSFKRRADVEIVEPALRAACRARLVDRLKPQVYRAFQFVATHAERYIVSRYDSAEAGFFRAHRDNTTKGTAHRRFAVTLNLNTGEYEGGALRFPEYGTRVYEAPLGGAIVFSCSLLHEATPVVRGVRYAFLPFLYDEAAARLREKNLPFVDLHDTAPDGAAR